MKRCLIVAALTLSVSPSFAQQPPKPAPAPPPAVQPAFPAGAKVAYVNLQYLASNSADGKAANAKVQALIKQRQAEISAKKTPQEQQAFQQQASQEVQQMQQQMQNEFQQKLFPVLQKMAQEKHLSAHLVGSVRGM